MAQFAVTFFLPSSGTHFFIFRINVSCWTRRRMLRKKCLPPSLLLKNLTSAPQTRCEISWLLCMLDVPSQLKTIVFLDKETMTCFLALRVGITSSHTRYMLSKTFPHETSLFAKLGTVTGLIVASGMATC